MKQAIIILHYGVLTPTVECLKSIQQLEFDKQNLYVVVVSVKDKRCDCFVDKFPDLNIDVLNINENLGYAKANNIAYQYIIRKGLLVDFVIVANNDIIFCQKNFLQKIAKIYCKKRYYVLGPDVILKYTHGHQNPIALHPPDRKGIRDAIMKYQKMLEKFNILYVKDYCINRLKDISDFLHLTLLFRKVSSFIMGRPVCNYSREIEGCLLTGACIIFSKDYLKETEQLFYDETFMYYEESFLITNCMKNNWKVMYSPKLKVYHNHSMSTAYLCKSHKNKIKFQVEEQLKSALLYEEYLKRYEH